MSSARLGREQVISLYEQHGPILLAYGISLLHDRSASEDVLHQVFVQLLQRQVGSMVTHFITYTAPSETRR